MFLLLACAPETVEASCGTGRTPTTPYGLVLRAELDGEAIDCASYHITTPDWGWEYEGYTPDGLDLSPGTYVVEFWVVRKDRMWESEVMLFEHEETRLIVGELFPVE